MAPSGGACILVVDDEPAVRAGLRRFLQAKGCTVAEAGGSLAALHLLEERRFDAVISDFHMPGLDGGQLWSLAVTRWPDLRHRFLFVTAQPPPALIAQGAPFVAKPFDLAELWARLVSLLDQPSQ